MSDKPKKPSELHPEYPKRRDFETTQLFIDAWGAFFKNHPEFDDEGSYEYRCVFCEGDADEDHDACYSCKEFHCGEWVLVDKNGDPCET